MAVISRETQPPVSPSLISPLRTSLVPLSHPATTLSLSVVTMPVRTGPGLMWMSPVERPTATVRTSPAWPAARALNLASVKSVQSFKFSSVRFS